MCKLFSILPIKTLSKLETKLMTSENKKDCKYMTSYCGAYTLFKETHLKETLIPSKETKTFESMKLNVPKDYDRFLTQIYGDYHKDPPKEKRILLQTKNQLIILTIRKEYLLISSLMIILKIMMVFYLN